MTSASSLACASGFFGRNDDQGPDRLQTDDANQSAALPFFFMMT